MNLLPIVVIKETKRDPRKAARIPETVKPSMKVEANQNKTAFITKVNRPRVNNVTGKVSKRRIGLTMALSTPKTKAAIIAIYRPSTSTPGTIKAAKRSASAPRRVLLMSFNIYRNTLRE